MEHSSNKARLYVLLCALVVVLGIFFRLWVFHNHDSFWKDEAGLARNFMSHDFAHIADPYGDGQVIPIGYAQICKVFEHFLGHSEHTFWAVSLIAGSVLLGLSAILFSAVLPAGAALIALSALAFNTSLIQYSVEFKAYIMDCLAALLMARAFFNYQAKGPNRNAFYLLAGIVSLWISYTAVFIIAGLGLWQLWEARKNKRLFSRIILVNAILATVFAVLWTTNYRFLNANGFFNNFWKDNFVPLPWQPGFIEWWSSVLPGTLSFLFGQEQILIWIFFIVLGLYRAWEINRRLLALTLPIVLTFLAGVLHVYPIYDRLVLFWVVLLTPFLALGVFYVWELLNKQYRTITVVFAVLVAIPFLHPLTRISHTHDFQQLKQVSVAISQTARPGDVVYLHARPASLYRYYFHRYPLAKGVKLVMGEKSDLEHLPQLMESRFKGHHVYFVYTEPWCEPDEIATLGQTMQARGELKSVLSLNLAGAFELQVK